MLMRFSFRCMSWRGRSSPKPSHFSKALSPFTAKSRSVFFGKSSNRLPLKSKKLPVQILFENSDPNRFKGILHLIGERPGTVHHSYSAYITVLKGKVWTEKKVDHDVTRLVCNIADTALPPKEAAEETLTIKREMIGMRVNNSRSSQ